MQRVGGVIKDLPRTRRQLHVEYPGGLRLWLNDHPTENWAVAADTRRHPNEQPRRIVLPPAGWLAVQENGDLFSYSALNGTNRVDYLGSRAYTYLDGRGAWFSAPEAASNGALAICPSGENQLRVIRISGAGAFVIRRPYGVRGSLARGEAFDVDGNRLAAPVWHDSGLETRIEPVDKAVRYELQFGGKGQ